MFGTRAVNANIKGTSRGEAHGLQKTVAALVDLMAQGRGERIATTTGRRVALRSVRSIFCMSVVRPFRARARSSGLLVSTGHRCRSSRSGRCARRCGPGNSQVAPAVHSGCPVAVDAVVPESRRRALATLAGMAVLRSIHRPIRALGPNSSTVAGSIQRIRPRIACGGRISLRLKTTAASARERVDTRRAPVKRLDYGQAASRPTSLAVGQPEGPRVRRLIRLWKLRFPQRCVGAAPGWSPRRWWSLGRGWRRP